MSHANISNNDALVLDQKNITATAKYLANIGQMTIAETIYTALTLKAVFQADIDATNALAASRAQVKQLVATAKAARAKANDERFIGAPRVTVRRRPPMNCDVEQARSGEPRHPATGRQYGEFIGRGGRRRALGGGRRAEVADRARGCAKRGQIATATCDARQERMSMGVPRAGRDG